MDIPWDPDNKSTIKSQVNRVIEDYKDKKPVCSVLYDKSTDNYRERLDEVLRTRFGYKINREDGISFLFDKNAIAILGHYVGTDAEAAAAIAAPYVLKRGDIISGHKYHNDGLYPSLTFAAPVELNKKVGVEAVTVLFADKDRVHSMRILDLDGKTFELPLIKEETTPEMEGVGNKAPLTRPTGVASKERITQDDGVVKKSERDDARTDRELLMGTEGYELTAAEKKALETYRAKVEDFEARERKVQAALDELDRLTRTGAGREAIQKQRTKVSNLQAGMNKALRELTQAETRDKTMLEIIRKEREIQRRRTSMATRETFTKRELRSRITKLYNDLNRRITSPSEKKNIPVPVMMQAIEVLDAINMDSSREKREFNIRNIHPHCARVDVLLCFPT